MQLSFRLKWPLPLVLILMLLAVAFTACDRTNWSGDPGSITTQTLSTVLPIGDSTQTRIEGS